MRLEGKTIVVTGGAQGIGRGIVDTFAAEGANIVIADINAENAAAAAEEVSVGAPSVRGVYVDVSNRETMRDAIARTVEWFGRLDVIVNNAGFNKPEPFLEISEKVWESILGVNTLGVLIGMQEAAKQFIAQGGGGKVINTASIAGRTGFPDFAAYSASKAGVISLTQAGARALATHGITVNAFAPGVVATPLWKQLDQDLYDMGASETPDGAMLSMAEQILLGRVSSPDDVAGTVLFLASKDSDYMTGQTLVIDGGMVLQ